VELQLNTSDIRNSEYTYIYFCTEVYAARTSMLSGTMKEITLPVFPVGKLERARLYFNVSTKRGPVSQQTN